MNERDCYLGFSMANGIGPKKFGLLLQSFGSAEKAWKAKESELEPILKPSLTAKFLSFRKEYDFGKYEKQFKKQKISLISLSDKEYPKLLKQIPNPPIVLYVKALRQAQGKVNLNDYQPAVAIVGTRHITNYGREITEIFASDLARAGLIVVSGMALGVDAVAHKAAIDANGKTIAVLGNGVDLPHPRENEKLYEEILDNGGAIISEYPPGMPPSAGSFPARNRIVAGISDGVLVTEGASDSGSLITANFGFEFGRKVFAVPGPITSSLSKGPHSLIEKGARLVTTAEEILREFQISNLKFQISTKIDSSKLGSLLSIMELKGLIKNLSDGNFGLMS
ncbi:MAG: DNA-protecting protein DprA [Candidatus Levybacteria bacterium]|nr:DNA-protecting protein DprA [Candidatus Levybacteria bacterium]